MKKTVNGLFALSFLLGISPAFADPEAPPQVCPSVAAIQSIGVSQNATQESTGLWFTGRRNQSYGTGSQWTLLMGNISAQSVAQAYLKANDALSSLFFQVGPVVGPMGKWLCYYNNSAGYSTIAVYPAVADNSNNSRTIYLHR